MKNYLKFLAIVSIFLFACQNNKPTEVIENTEVETIETVMEAGEIKLSTNHQATEFENASLNLVSPKQVDLDTGIQNFRFEVQNFELASPTRDILSGQCANSEKGQHIHFIKNNEPYEAFYEAEFESEIGEGHNVILAFLSRSYHMSVKNSSAYVLKEFSNGNVVDNFDEQSAHLFYSRPVGTYEANDAQKIMLDFYLINTDLKDKGYRVEATINDTSVFLISTWEPYFIEGLAEGENKIKLELQDELGNTVKSPFNPVERKISVKY